MNSISREGLDPSEIITKQNVLTISERIALRSLRTVLSISFNMKLNRLYIGLNNDVTYKNRSGYILSDGNDLVRYFIANNFIFFKNALHYIILLKNTISKSF